VTPEQCAVEYLEKHGMIPGYDFVPSTAVDKAAKLYTEFKDADLDMKPMVVDSVPEGHLVSGPYLMLSGWPGGEPLTGEL
jgi:hypothetical protein